MEAEFTAVISTLTDNVFDSKCKYSLYVISSKHLIGPNIKNHNKDTKWTYWGFLQLPVDTLRSWQHEAAQWRPGCAGVWQCWTHRLWPKVRGGSWRPNAGQWLSEEQQDHLLLNLDLITNNLKCAAVEVPINSKTVCQYVPLNSIRERAGLLS